MADLLDRFRVATWGLHGVVAVVLVVLLAKTGVMAGWCIFPGLLIACAGASASPGQPLTVYSAFGALMGFSFWEAVGEIHSGHYLELIPALLLLVGASWFLREPEWPSFLFSVVMVALWLALLAWIWDRRFELADTDPDDAIKKVRTSVVVLVVGMAYLAAGLAQVKLGRSRRKKKSRAIRTPVDPPVL